MNRLQQGERSSTLPVTHILGGARRGRVVPGTALTHLRVIPVDRNLL